MPKASRKQVQKEQAILARRKQIWELTRRGWTQSRIADHLGVDQSLVSLDLKAISNEYWSNIIGEKKQEATTQIAQLQFIMGESLEAWERSKGPKRSITKHLKSNPVPTSPGVAIESEEERTINRAEMRDGDTRYLDAARAAMEDIRKIMGLNSPEQVQIFMAQVTGTGGHPNSNLNGTNWADVRGIDPVRVEEIRQSLRGLLPARTDKVDNLVEPE